MKVTNILIIILAVILVTIMSSLGIVSAQQCVDGTPEGGCSSTPPLKCEGGRLVERCQECGCSGLKTNCQSSGICTKWPSIHYHVHGNIYYTQWDCDSQGYLQALGCQTHNDFGRNWTFYGQNYDAIINIGPGYDIVKSEDPAISTGQYFVTHYIIYSENLSTPGQYAFVKQWASDNGYDFEDFLLHYKQDIERTLNYWAGRDPQTRFIPGWDDANDPNSDGVNDYLYYDFYKIQWDNTGVFSYTITRPGFQEIPSNNIYIISNGYAEVTSSFSIDISGNTVTINPNSGITDTPLTIFIPYIGEIQSGAPNPNAYAANRSQARVPTHYWNQYINYQLGPDILFPTAISMIWHLRNTTLQQGIAEYFHTYLTNAKNNNITYEFAFIDDSNGRLPDGSSVCDNCITGNLTVEDYEANRSKYLEALADTFRAINTRLNNTEFENFEIYPNTAGTLLFGYWPPELFEPSHGFVREWSHQLPNPEWHFLSWKNHLQESADNDKWQFLHFRGTHWYGMGMPYEREMMWALATYYMFKYPKLSMMYGYKGWSGYWFEALEKDVGEPDGPVYVWNSFNDTNFAWDAPGGGDFTDFCKVQNIYRRNYTKGVVFSWYEKHDWKCGLDLFNNKTLSLDPEDLNQGYCILNANGSLGECNPTEINMQQASGLILIKTPGQTCYDVNSDNKINIIDLVLVIFHQGRNSGDIDWNSFRHLDLNNDTMINFADVSSVISSFGQSC